MTMVDNHIHSMKPIAAPSEHYKIGHLLPVLKDGYSDFSVAPNPIGNGKAHAFDARFVAKQILH